MIARFIIYQASEDANRPPISCKIREYYMKFITDNVLIKQKIIVDGKWNVGLGIIFISDGARYKSKEIIIAKGAPRIVKEQSLKLYQIIVPLTVIQEAEEPLLKTIELMFEAITVFLTTVYKKITREFMDELWRQVDLSYLLNLPYPATLSEQKYIGDGGVGD